MEKAKVYAKLKYVHISAKKVKLSLDIVRGKKVSEAERVLKFNDTKASEIVLKVLKSAVSNAKNNMNLKEESLYIHETYVGQGPVRKTGRFAGRGRVSPILKRSSHIVVGLSERENGSKS